MNKSQSISKIIVRPQTAEEEFRYLMRVLGKMDFYNKNGYAIPIPDHPFFINISNNLDLLKSLNIEKAKNIFKTEIYDLTFFENGLKTVNQDINLVRDAMEEIKKWTIWGFKLFSKYEIRLTSYGPGGSYNWEKGNIIMKTKLNGIFGLPPVHTIVHEIIHIGIEESVVKKFELSHVEKEGLVDAICVNYFKDMLTNYKIQDRRDKKVFNLISQSNINKLPQIVSEYKMKQQLHKT